MVIPICAPSTLGQQTENRTTREGSNLSINEKRPGIKPGRLSLAEEEGFEPSLEIAPH